MKAVFIQLPVMDPTWDSAKANVPLAAGNLASYAVAMGLLAREEACIVPDDCLDYGSDLAVLQGIVACVEGLKPRSLEPVLICFTLYSWNLERSAWLARRLRAVRPDAILVAGGPEIAGGMPILHEPAFDVIVEGEGEGAFCELLSDLAAARGHARHYVSHALIDLAKLPNPYLEGFLEAGPEKQVYVESMRGCPARCSYCNYGKRYDTVRHFPEKTLYETIRFAAERNARDLYLMDPSFQAHANLSGKLAKIATANSTGMRLHAEIRLESVSEELAMLYAEAGVESLEAGLQSTNPRALEAVGRAFDAQAFERGAGLLRREGIFVKTGLILGLPFDGYDDVIHTFDFLGMTGLGQDAELYPLAVLPGTPLRAQAQELGLRHFDAPPYWVLSTPSLSSDEISDAVAAFEESFDVEWGPLARPHFDPWIRGYRAMIDLRDPQAVAMALDQPERLSNSLTIVVDPDNEGQVQEACRVAQALKAANPFTLYQLVLYSNRRVPKPRTVRKLIDAFANPEHYYERSHFFSHDPQKSWQTRVYYATRDPGLAADAMEDGSPLEIIAVWGDEMAGSAHPDAEYIAEMLPFVAYDREACSHEAMRELVLRYAEYRDIILPASDSLFPPR